jgi:hypothetical protein
LQVLQLIARQFDSQMQPEAAMPEKIQIMLVERKRRAEATFRSQFFDELEADARRVDTSLAQSGEGIEVRRDLNNREVQMRSRPGRPRRPEMGGGGLYPGLGLPEAYDMLTIGLATAAGAAVTAAFARNVIGLAKDWIELTKNTERSVTVKIGNKVVKIKQGDDILAIVRQHFPDDGTSNPL